MPNTAVKEMKKLFWCIILYIISSVTGYAHSVMMIGDSHVAGKIYPHTVDSVLSCKLIKYDFHFWGINGAAFPTFCKPENMDSIIACGPDILIVHLGTNDSYTRNFKTEVFRNNLSQFYDSVHRHLPKTKIVFITPFVNKLKIRQRGRKRPIRKINDNTRVCADIINQFCNEHANTWCVDHNALYGMHFINSGLIRKDFVHLSADGYRVLGSQVGDEIIRIPNLFKKYIRWELDNSPLNIGKYISPVNNSLINF